MINLPEDPLRSDALRAWRKRGTLPTTLSSSEISQIDGFLKRQAVFSAATDYADHLQFIQDHVSEILAGRMDQSTAVLRLKEMLEVLEYHPSEEDAGSIKDLGSFARRSLVVQTNVETARGAGQYAAANSQGALDAFPAWELIRAKRGKTARDWHARWLQAARASGDTDAIATLTQTSRMIALKTSPIWDSLGDPALFPDALGNPFPPFAFSSGMTVKQIPYTEALRLGVIKRGLKQEAPKLDFAAGGKIPNGLAPPLRAALLQSLGPGYRFDSDGVLTNRSSKFMPAQTRTLINRLISLCE